MKYLKIALRLIPTLLATAVLLVPIIFLGMGPVGSEAGENATRQSESSLQEIFMAIWGWAFSGKYERNTYMSDYYKNK